MKIADTSYLDDYEIDNNNRLRLRDDIEAEDEYMEMAHRQRESRLSRVILSNGVLSVLAAVALVVVFAAALRGCAV